MDWETYNIDLNDRRPVDDSRDPSSLERADGSEAVSISDDIIQDVSSVASVRFKNG